MIFVSCPYSHKDPAIVVNRYLILNEYLAKLMNDGKYPISPIALGHPLIANSLLSELTENNHEFWMEYSKELFMASKEIHFLMMEGWDVSSGVTNEIEWTVNKIHPNKDLPISWIKVKYIDGIVSFSRL